MDLLHNVDVYAAYCTNSELRMNSSSGGIFPIIARSVLFNGGVVYGAAYDEKFHVHHIGIESVDKLSLLCGAKYSQSYIGDSFHRIQEHLQRGQEVLFSGTPCQIATLKKYLKKNYEKLLCVDFVCHGVPLASIWKKYVEYRSLIDNSGKPPVKINLRSKHTGWSRYNYSNLYEYQDGINYSALSGSDLFMKLFTGDYINAKSCSNCHYKGFARESDITLGDFWGIWDIAPEMDDNRGTSLVMIQTEKGTSVWNKIQSQVNYKKMTLDDASQQNPSILYSSPVKPEREEMIKLCLDGRWTDVEKLLPVPREVRKISRMKSQAKSFIRTIFCNHR